MVGRPYVVAGRTYVPRPGKDYDREGWASWYGTAFHGRLTANGEIFDRGSIAAAHPILPLPSYVRVTNLANKRSMIVRVNDRGPYEANRIIDLSERAAEALDMRRKGTVRVRVQYLRRASTNGSDDEVLLATLRTDGTLAQLGTAQRTTIAQAEEREPAPRPLTVAREQVRPRQAGAPEPGRHPPDPPSLRRGQPVEAGTTPIDIRPPRRPELAGIY